MKKWVGAVAALTVLFAGGACFAKELKVDDFPPQTIKTVPACGEKKVDPDLDKIVITFSKDMKQTSWSVCQISDDSFPKSDGQAGFKNDRTFVFPVKLEPNKTYVLRLNWGKFNNFRDEDNQPAVPYLLVFKTKDR